jgi:hypothetical protein
LRRQRVATVNAFLTVGFSHVHYGDHRFTLHPGNNSTVVRRVATVNAFLTVGFSHVHYGDHHFTLHPRERAPGTVSRVSWRGQGPEHSICATPEFRVNWFC